MVDGDPMEPGGEGGFTAKLVEGAVGLEKDLLRRILAVRGIGKKEGAKPDHLYMVLPYKRFISLRLTG